MLERRAELGVCIVVLVVSLVAIPLVGATGSAATPEPATTDTNTNTTTADVKVVYLESNETAGVWPYTSRQKKFDTLTLPINVVIETDAAHVRRILAGSEGTNSSWTAEGPENETVLLNGTDVPWSKTDGATRYTYVETDEGGQWVDETYQLHNGTYFGSRIHLRLYELESGRTSWTAIQAHKEHFNWFRLRHTVSSVADGRRHVERDFYGSRYLSDIERQRFANGGIMDTDGWVTVIKIVDWTGGGPPISLVPLGLGLAIGLGRSQAGSIVSATRAAADEVELSVWHAVVLVGLAVMPIGVRLAGIALETVTPLGAMPKLIFVLLYPVLAVGIPLVAVIGGRRLPPVDGFAVAAFGLGLGLVGDYTYLDVSTLPLQVVMNRVWLLVAVGLLAAGGTHGATEWAQRHRFSVVGGLFWIVGLAWALFDLGSLVAVLLRSIPIV